MEDSTDAATDYQRKLFALLQEFFVRATGKEAHAFARVTAFSEVVRRNAHKIASRCEQALPWAERELRTFYGREGPNAFHLARQLAASSWCSGAAADSSEVNWRPSRGACCTQTQYLCQIRSCLGWRSLDQKSAFVTFSSCRQFMCFSI